MDKTRIKIKSVCTMLLVCSLISACTVFVNSFHGISSLVGFLATQSSSPADQYVPFIINSFFGLLAGVVFLYSAYIFYEIGKAGTPFIEKTAKRLKLISIAIFIYLIFPSITPLIHFITIELPSVGISAPNLFYITSIIVTALITSGIVYGLALIFQYGTLLQSDSDEIV